MAKEFKKGKMVPVPSHSIVPERDVNKLPVLECQHLGIDFGGLTAVNEFNLTIGRTEIAGLIGPNGAGKTTVFNLLTKVYQPTRGTILLNGKDTHGMSTAQVNRAGIARTFQNIRLFSNLSVEDNVKIGLHNQIRYPMWDGVLRLPKFWKQEKLARESAMELLSIFDMQDLAHHQAGSLPYGAQRRLEIVRALATNPSLLLLDEPAAGMNLSLIHISPCLITCIKELNTPRYMSVPGIFECYSKPYEVFGYETLKDDPLIDPTTIGLKGSPTNIFKSFTPPQKGAGMMLEGADKATCDKLAGILATKHII